MREKSLSIWIKENRKEIDKCVQRILGEDYKLNDKERRLWILNDEGLYNWARRKKVNV